MKKLEARFFRTLGGIEPVREFLKELAPQDRKTLGMDIATVEYASLPVTRQRSLGSPQQHIRQEATFPTKGLSGLFSASPTDKCFCFMPSSRKRKKRPKPTLTLL
ncbi:hypothetical protein ABIE64_002042 [Thalassospira sp. MBR-102]|jgi:hypothetical protein